MSTSANPHEYWLFRVPRQLAANIKRIFRSFTEFGPESRKKKNPAVSGGVRRQL
jgi:hypothetical protein